jgi:cation diffusion facilitator CzcD-associated flavoprotein CzcO
VTDVAPAPSRLAPDTDEPVLIIGAGVAGPAVAARLGKMGIRAEILECGDGVAYVWRLRYDRMRMNTCRWNIRLWFGRFPQGTPAFPTRDQFVRYMESYVAKHDVKVRYGVRVDRIDQVAGGWQLATSAGDLTARQVIVATGHDRTPRLPDWPGRDLFPGRLIHSVQYRNPREFRGADVLVVGSGCSGADIAADLAYGGAARVRLAVRSQPHIMMRKSPWGPNDLVAAALQRMPLPIADSMDRFIRRTTVGNLASFGLRVPEEGTFTTFRRDDAQPTVVDPDFIEGVKTGRIEIVAGVSCLDTDGVQLTDGTRLQPDAIVAATGFSNGLAPLVGHLGVLDDQGQPLSRPGSGLYFLGYGKGVGVIGPNARRATEALCRELASERLGSSAAVAGLPRASLSTR